MTNYFLPGLKDFKDSLGCWRIWLLLGWQDIRLRYRRSVLGPFWITISTSVMIGIMGFLYGHLFKTNLQEYFPFLSIGVVLWTFISSMLNESPDAFIESQAYIRQLSLPFCVYSLRLVVRHLIVLLHNAAPVLVVLIFFQHGISFFQFLQFLFGFSFLIFTAFIYGTILAILGARFRDLRPIINSLVQVVFFMTPIMWQPSMLSGRYVFAYKLNPFYQFLSLIRFPLTGHDLSLFGLLYDTGFLAVGFLILLGLMSRARHRIAYWV